MHKKRTSKIKKIITYLWLAIALSMIVYLIFNANLAIWKKGTYSLFRIFLLVGVASFVGAVIEYRAWTRFIVFIASPVTKFGRLPSLSAVSLITALFSQNAANTLIANSYREGDMTRREMIVSALCNSFLAMVSHSFRILLPLLSLIGMAAVWYYSFTFGVGLLMTIVFLLISRILSKRDEVKSETAKVADLEDIVLQKPQLPEKQLKKSYSWSEVFRKASMRTSTTLLRLLYITAPIYLMILFMAKSHLFDFWSKIVPDSLQEFLTPEIMTVFTARIGGLLNAAGIASEFLQSNKIENWQIVVAFMIGNVITNPIRTIRRNLPMAMGIFPKSYGLWIVLTLQSLRMVTAIIAIVVMILVYG